MPTNADQLGLVSAAYPPKCKLNMSLPFLRPLAADIPGNHTERLYFHQFRQVAEEALGIRHVHNSLFWKQIVPQYCQEVTAVRHAYIAVGAAYSHFQLAGRKPNPNAPPTEVERFVINQYTKAMKNIAIESQGLPIKRQYGIMMMCCVAFFCIEVLRGQWDKALSHLTNGVKMMADLPDDVADILHNPAKWSQGMDTSYVRVSYMIQLLTRWEVSVGHLAANFQPRLTMQAYTTRQLNQSVTGGTRSVEELQDVVDSFCQDVNAFCWQSNNEGGDEVYWSEPGRQLQQWALKERCEDISDLLDSHRDLNGEYPVSSTNYTSYYVSKLNHRVAALKLHSNHTSYALDDPVWTDLHRIEELVDIAVAIQEAHADMGNKGVTTSSVDIGVVPALHVAARYCQDPETKVKIAALIREWPQRRSVWDGPMMRTFDATD